MDTRITCALTVVARLTQILFALIALACLAALLQSHPDGPSLVNYSLWVSIINILEGGLGIVLCFVATRTKDGASAGNNAGSNGPRTKSPNDGFCISVTFGMVVGFFTFCSAVAFAAIVPPSACTDEDALANNSVAYGSRARCTTGQAATAFLWLTGGMLGLAIIGSCSTTRHLDDQTMDVQEVRDIIFRAAKDIPQAGSSAAHTSTASAPSTNRAPPMTAYAASAIPYPPRAATASPQPQDDFSHEDDGPPQYSQFAYGVERVSVQEEASSRVECEGIPWRGFSSLFNGRHSQTGARDSEGQDNV